jgi:hypothetical protein
VTHENILLSADFQKLQTTCDWIVRETAKVILRLTVSRRVCLAVRLHLGPKIRFLFLSDSCGFVDVVRPLLREGGSVVCRWSSPGQSFSRPSPSIYIPQEEGDIVIPQALGSLFVASYNSQGCSGGVRTRLHAGVTGLSKSKSHYNWRSVSQSVCQGIKPTLELVTRYYFLSEGCFLKVADLSLWSALSDERSGLSFVFLGLVIY